MYKKKLYYYLFTFLNILSIVVVCYNKDTSTLLLLREYKVIGVNKEPIKKLQEVTANPEQNEIIGTLIYPKADMSVPLLYGYNEAYMAQYSDEVGLEAWGNFPGQDNKIYINGHRHLSFQNLKYIEVGDQIILKMDYGEFTYEVVQEPKVVLATDKEAIDFYLKDRDKVFFPQILRLQTCYPFEAGSTLDHRYLVDLILVNSVYF